VLLFSLQLSNAGGQYAVALIGAAFLAAYAIWRVYGLLIPGGILLVLGAGFASIYVIDASGDHATLAGRRSFPARSSRRSAPAPPRSAGPRSPTSCGCGRSCSSRSAPGY